MDALSIFRNLFVIPLWELLFLCVSFSGRINMFWMWKWQKYASFVWIVLWVYSRWCQGNEPPWSFMSWVQSISRARGAVAPYFPTQGTRATELWATLRQCWNKRDWGVLSVHFDNRDAPGIPSTWWAMSQLATTVFQDLAVFILPSLLQPQNSFGECCEAVTNHMPLCLKKLSVSLQWFVVSNQVCRPKIPSLAMKDHGNRSQGPERALFSFFAWSGSGFSKERHLTGEGVRLEHDLSSLSWFVCPTSSLACSLCGCDKDLLLPSPSSRARPPFTPQILWFWKGKQGVEMLFK